MAIFQEAVARIQKDVYVCKKCEAKIRSSISKFLNNKVVCRKCKCKRVRPLRMKSKK